jgi:hypothetical protein
MDGQYKQDAGKNFVTMLSLWIRHFRRKTCNTPKRASIFFRYQKKSVKIYGFSGPNHHYQNGGILLVFLSSNKTLPLVIAYGNLTRRHLVGKIYTKF